MAKCRVSTPVTTSSGLKEQYVQPGWLRRRLFDIAAVQQHVMDGNGTKATVSLKICWTRDPVDFIRTSDPENYGIRDSS